MQNPRHVKIFSGLLFVLFSAVSLPAQNLNDDSRSYQENVDAGIVKPVSDEELPELFDAKVQIAVARQDSVDQEVNGFRVQIYKTETMNDSKEKQVLYAEMFGENSVKLVFEEPFYKIRVGNFRTRNEAETFQDELLRNGFRSTIVVPDKVIVRSARKR